MTFKKFLEKTLKNKEEMTLARYKSAKFLFIAMTFVFFLNYFFVGAQFHYDFFIKTLTFSYILYLIAFLFYVFYFFKLRVFSKLKWKIAEVIFFVFLLIIFLVFSLIVIVWKDIVLF